MNRLYLDTATVTMYQEGLGFLLHSSTELQN